MRNLNVEDYERIGNLDLVIQKLEQEPDNREHRNEAIEIIATLESQEDIDLALDAIVKITGVELEEWNNRIEIIRRKIQKDGENESKGKIIKTSFYNKGDIIVEQVYCDGESSFLVYNSKTEELQNVKTYEDGDSKIIPLNGVELELGGVKLPTDAMEFGSIKDLLNEIQSHLKRYVDFSEGYLMIASYYILVSWLYDRFNTIPYLRALGDTGCGKSRLLDVVGGLCYKPMSISGAVTPAPIYRLIRKWKGTLIVDEADIRGSDVYNDLVNIFNCGYEKGRPVVKANMDNQDDVIHYQVYCPKLLATRKRFIDKALEGRCLTEIMKETNRTDLPYVLNADFEKCQLELRNKLLLYRFRNFSKVTNDRVIQLNLKGIEPRLQQIVSPILTILIDDNESVNAFKEFLYYHQKEIVTERSNTQEGQVLLTLFSLIESKQVFHSGNFEFLPITAKEIAEKLGNGISSNSIGQILKGLGISTKVTRIPEDLKTSRCIIYDKPTFDTLKERYILVEEIISDNFVTTVTSVTSDTDITSEVEEENTFTEEEFKFDYSAYKSKLENYTN